MQNQNLCRWKWIFYGDWKDAKDQKKIKNNVIREKMSIKNSVLDYIRYKQLNWQFINEITNNINTKNKYKVSLTCKE